MKLRKFLLFGVLAAIAFFIYGAFIHKPSAADIEKAIYTTLEDKRERSKILSGLELPKNTDINTIEVDVVTKKCENTPAAFYFCNFKITVQAPLQKARTFSYSRVQIHWSKKKSSYYIVYGLGHGIEHK